MGIDNAEGDHQGRQEGRCGDRAAALNDHPSLVTARDKDGSTPLHCAAWNGREDVAAILLDAGADINDHNQNGHWGTTPLHAAAHGNQKQVAALLIARGADLEARNLNGRTPLEETGVHNAKAVARLLTEAAPRS